MFQQLLVQTHTKLFDDLLELVSICTVGYDEVFAFYNIMLCVCLFLFLPLLFHFILRGKRHFFNAERWNADIMFIPHLKPGSKHKKAPHDEGLDGRN